VKSPGGRVHPIGDRQELPGIRRRCNEPAFGLITDRGRRILPETDISFNINKINGFYHCRERLEKSDLSKNPVNLSIFI
jgi:hypothetical protein